MRYEVLVRHVRNKGEGETAYWYDRILIEGDDEETALALALRRLRNCDDGICSIHEQGSGESEPFSVDTGSMQFPSYCTTPPAAVRAMMESELERRWG